MLHRHLTSAFRALDSKWGPPIDLDFPQEPLKTCHPAVTERPSTTFSSEEYLRTIKRRPKPYSRQEEVTYRRSRDSFSNISLSRYQSASDVGRSVSSLESKPAEPCVIEELAALVEDLKKPVEDHHYETIIFEDEGVQDVQKCLEDRTETAKAEVAEVVAKKKRELDRIFGRLKEKAFALVDLKYRNIL